MKKIIIITLVLLTIPVASYAFDIHGYLFCGQYASNLNVYCEPSQENLVQYRAGFKADISLWKDYIVLYDKTTILMNKRTESNGFHPAGGQFNIGLRLKYSQHEIRFEHECWHPIDSEGDVAEYNLIEYRLHF